MGVAAGKQASMDTRACVGRFASMRGRMPGVCACVHVCVMLCVYVCACTRTSVIASRPVHACGCVHVCVHGYAPSCVCALTCVWGVCVRARACKLRLPANSSTPGAATEACRALAMMR